VFWIGDVEALGGRGIQARDADQSLAAGLVEVFHDLGHGGDDGAEGEAEAVGAFLALPVADVVQAGFS
jgi:hypothetical protein